MQYFLNKDQQFHKWRHHKWWTLYQGYQVVQDKPQTQYPLTPRSNCKMHGRYWKFQSQNVQIFGYVDWNTNCQNHGPVCKTQSFVLNEICTVIFCQYCYGKGNLRTSYENTVGRRFPIGNVYSYTVKRVILICVCEWQQIVWKETKYQSDLEDTHERRWFGRTDIILWPWLFGLFSTRTSNKQGYCRQVQNYVRIQGFCWVYGTATCFREIGCEYFFMVLWHGRSCKKMCGKMFGILEWYNATILQSRDAMHGWPSMQRRRDWISWRVVHSLFTHCSEMSIYGSYW